MTAVEASVEAVEFRFVLNRRAARALREILYRSSIGDDSLRDLNAKLAALLDLEPERRP